MKRILYATIILAFVSITPIWAQIKGTGKVGIGLELGLPTGDFSKNFDKGIGASFMYQKAFVDNAFYTINIGYVSYTGKTTLIGLNLKYNMDYLPIKAGLKYYFSPHIYGSGEIGASFAAGGGANGTSFVYSPGIGMEFPVGEKNSLDIGARYEAWSNKGTISFFGLRAAFNINL